MVQKIASISLTSRASKYLLIFLLLAGFGLKIYLVYYGYIYNHYLVPPGNDAVPHYLAIKSILESGKFSFSSYPPGFYFLVIAIAKVFGKDVFTILTYWTPALIILSPLAMYFLLRQLFDLKVSVLTTLILLLASSYPVYAFIDGNYPDMLAYGILAVLLFAFLIRFLKSHRFRNLAVAGIILVLIALTHHLTFLIVLSVLTVFALVLVLSNRKYLYFVLSAKHLLVVISGILVLGVCLYFAFNIYGRTIMLFLEGFFRSSPGVKDAYLNLPLKLSDYPMLMGPLVWFLGILGLFYLIVSTFQERKDTNTKILLIIWVIGLFLLSRMTSAAIPGRFARELALPLIICIGYLINFILNMNSFRFSRLGLMFGYGLMSYVILINSMLFTGIGSLPDSFNEWVWFWPVDQQKIDYLKTNVDSSVQILYNPNANIYTPIKASNALIPLVMNNEQKAVVKSYLDDQNKTNAKAFNTLVSTYKSEYANIGYIFIDVKPPSNPDPVTYWPYAGFIEKDTVLRALAARGTVLKRFSDGAEIIQL